MTDDALLNNIFADGVVGLPTGYNYNQSEEEETLIMGLKNSGVISYAMFTLNFGD